MWYIFVPYHYTVIKYNFVSQYKICTKQEIYLSHNIVGCSRNISASNATLTAWYNFIQKAFIAIYCCRQQ